VTEALHFRTILVPMDFSDLARREARGFLREREPFSRHHELVEGLELCPTSLIFGW